MNILSLPQEVYTHIFNKLTNVADLNNLYLSNKELRKSITNYSFFNHTLTCMGKLFIKYYYKYLKYLFKLNLLRDRVDNLSNNAQHDSDSSMDINDFLHGDIDSDEIEEL